MLQLLHFSFIVFYEHQLNFYWKVVFWDWKTIPEEFEIGRISWPFNVRDGAMKLFAVITHLTRGLFKFLVAVIKKSDAIHSCLDSSDKINFV